jgi:hypothetical protein
VAKSKTWPDSPRALAGRLRRAATFLRKVGIDIGFEREGRARTRIIRITTTGQSPAPESRGAQPSASSAPSANSTKANAGNGFGTQGSRTVGDPADRSRRDDGPTVRANPLISNAEDDADGADAKPPRQSAPANAGWRTRL